MTKINRKEDIMTFQITDRSTDQIEKVEFKNDPEQSNVAFSNYGPAGEALLVLGVPSAIGSTLATIRQYGAFPARPLLIEVQSKPEQVGGSYFEAVYAGRIEIR
jgi:hypothetical protein